MYASLSILFLLKFNTLHSSLKLWLTYKKFYIIHYSNSFDSFPLTTKTIFCIADMIKKIIVFIWVFISWPTLVFQGFSYSRCPLNFLRGWHTSWNVQTHLCSRSCCVWSRQNVVSFLLSRGILDQGKCRKTSMYRLSPSKKEKKEIFLSTLLLSCFSFF